MHTIKLTVRASPPPRLSPCDCGDAYALMQDPYQSPRARKRALALILMDQGIAPDVVLRRTGVGISSQREMMARLSTSGFKAAIFGSPRRLDQRRYNVKAIAGVMRSCFRNRPPPGAAMWNLVHLTAVVRRQVAGAESISKETIRDVLKTELGIKSIRDLSHHWHTQARRATIIAKLGTIEDEQTDVCGDRSSFTSGSPSVEKLVVPV